MAGVMIDIPGVGVVEAKNAATEATLRDILKAINDGAGGGYKKGGKPGIDEKNKNGGKDNKGNDKADDGKKTAPSLFGLGKAVGAAIRPIQQATGGFMALGEQSANLIQKFANVGDSFSGAAAVFSGIPVLGTVFAAVAAAADKTLGSYQKATSSGATFGNSLNNFAASASAAGMTMDKFGALIAQNGEALMTLGGTTESGAKRFANAAKEIRNSNVGAQLYGLGMTTEQVNQGMANYIKIVGTGGALQGKSSKELAQGAGAYLKELDAIAKITGQNREAIQKEQEARMKDAQFIAATAKMDPKARAELNNFISQFPKESQEAIKDMITTGNITSDAAIEFNAQMGGTSQEIMKIGQLVRDQGKFNKAEGDAAYRFAVREGKLRHQTQEYQTLGLYGGQQFAKSTVAIAELASREIDGKEKALTEQEKAEKARAAALEKSKQTLAEYSNSFQMALANSGLLDLLMKAFQVAADLVMNWVVPAFQIFSAVVTEVGTFLLDSLKPVFEVVSTFIKDTLYPIFLDLAAIIMVDVWPALQAVGDVIQTYVWPALQTIGGVIMDYVYPVFEKMYLFIADNLQPILLALGTALVAYAGYVTIMNGLELIRNGLIIASNLGLTGLATAAWGAALPFLKIAAPVLALVGIFAYLYKTGWSLDTALEAVKDNFMRFTLYLDDVINGLLRLLNKVTFGALGITEEELALRQKENDSIREDLKKKEQARDKERELKAEERSSENKAAERKAAAAKIDQKLIDLKNKATGGLGAANDREQKARDKAAELKENALNYEDTTQLLVGYAQQQKSAFIKNPENKTTEQVEGAKNEVVNQAEAKKKEEEERKKAQRRGRKEESSTETEQGPAGPRRTTPATQESAETLLASLNTKMDQLIKINKGVHEVNEKQLNVQQSFSGDVFASV